MKSTANSDRTPPLFEDYERDGESLSDPDLLGPWGKRARLVRVLPNVLEALSGASLVEEERQISLNLFAGEEAGAGALPVSFRTKVEANEAVTFFGAVEGDEGSYVSMTLREDMMEINVASAEGLFEVVSWDREAQAFVVRELDEALLPGCGVDGSTDLEPEPDPKEEEKGESAAEDTVLSIMVCYTKDVSDALKSEAAVKTRISDALNRANDVFTNSNVEARLKLVHSVELTDYKEATGDKPFYTMLDELVAGTATGLKTLHDLRNTHKADLVCLLVKDGSLGGLAYTMTTASAGWAKWAYSVVNYEVSASTWTMGHEIAHNLGCGHQDGNSKGPDYARGHSFKGNDQKLYKTVMVEKSQPGTRVPHLSNPAVKYSDTATGVADKQDNARIVTDNWKTTANFRKG